MKSVLVAFALVAFIFNLCSAYRVLVVFPFPSRSHSILGEGFVNHLTNAGHDVTYITAYPMKNPVWNLRQVEVASNREYGDKIMEKYTIETLVNGVWDMEMVTTAFSYSSVISNGTISNQDVRKIMLDPNEKFDAVVVEWMFSELYAGFAAVFDCPLIWSSSVEPHDLVLSLIDEIPNPAYTPNPPSSAEVPFTFWERLKEISILAFNKILRAYTIYIEKEIYKNVFGAVVEKRGRKLPPYENIIYNASLMFGNSHVSSGLSVRLPQNYKAIGGYHISKNSHSLPEDLKDILDKAENGVIYFSLGSVMKSKSIPMEMKQSILETFRELKQTVIWKFEGELTNAPTNVKILKWAPQQSILAHQNCILFITHGGLLSITESLHFGVPVIGIPLFGDQFMNIKRAESRGFGKEVNLDHDIASNLKVSIEEVLKNPRYSERALELSLVYHDRPVTPGEELVHWVEHVVKTRGAPHLRSPALMVPWYQKMSLDVLLFISALIYIPYKCIQYLFAFRKNTVDLLKKNK